MLKMITCDVVLFVQREYLDNSVFSDLVYNSL